MLFDNVIYMSVCCLDIIVDHCIRCQDVLLDNMKLGPNIARNAALRENVFMMALCVELRIPLFLVGKPGSSKSLAKSIVADSLLGWASENELLKGFKEVTVMKIYTISIYSLTGPHVLLSVQSIHYT